MNRKVCFFVLGLLVALMLPASLIATFDPDGAEIEPNDTMDTATLVTIGDTEGRIGVEGDVDYFKISLEAGQPMYFAALAGSHMPKVRLAVLDAQGQVLVETQDWPDDEVIFNFITPVAGDYYLRVVARNSYSTGSYGLLVRLMPDGESNHRPEYAIPVQYGSSVNSYIFAPYDRDYYRLSARAGDLVELTFSVDELIKYYAVIDIASENGDSTGKDFLDEPGSVTFQFLVIRDGDYIINPNSAVGFWSEVTYPRPYRLDINRRSLYVAAQNAGEVNGVAFGLNDILARNAAGDWELVFDGEDVGLTVPIAGFEMTSDGAILIALNKAQSLPGIGSVKPFDIVKFTPTKLGETTGGTFSFYLRGSQAGLSVEGEQIDAIAIRSTGELIISTTGLATLPNRPGYAGINFKVSGKCLLQFYPLGPMPSGGYWSKYDCKTHLNKFGSQNLRMATIYNEKFRLYSMDFLDTSDMLFGTNATYSYQHYVKKGDWYHATAGDLIRENFVEDECCRAVTLDAPLTWTAMNFPHPIASVSHGPLWVPDTTPTPTPVPTQTATPTLTKTPTATPTMTRTPQPTPTHTPRPTETPTPAATTTATAIPMPSPTVTGTAVLQPTATLDSHLPDDERVYLPLTLRLP
jgi:hypothetical protein